MKLRDLVCAALFLLFASARIFAQSDTAQISGFVKDPTGSAIPNAAVTLQNEATGLERRTTANESGYWVVSSLPPGFYTVSVEAPGFKRYVTTQNKLDSNIAATVDATLEVGSVRDTVEVVASAAGVQSETATVGKLIESSQIQNMMLNGRNAIFLALLKPGVKAGLLNGFAYAIDTGGIVINGGRTQDFSITYDGAPARSTRGNFSSTGVPDLDAVQEIQILTSGFYNAEYGGTSSGSIRVATRSGGRKFHGSLFEYFRNNELDANTWARNRAGQPRETRRFNQFGYNFNGPVYIPGKWNSDKNKLFFFWSQEWVRFRREATSIITVPSLAMRRGDFSELLNAANPFFGRVRTVNDPTNGRPFGNNVIPQSSLSPNGLAFLSAYPEPVPGFRQGTSNFFQTRPQPENQRKDTISVDFIPTEKHTVRFRHQNYTWNQAAAFQGGTDRAVQVNDHPAKTASLNHIWTINPTTVNEAMITVSLDQVASKIDTAPGRHLRSRYGITYPYIFPSYKEIYDKIPNVAISNFVELDGSRAPAYFNGVIYVVSDNFTKTRGSHTLKFGGQFQRTGSNDFDQIFVTGVPGGTNNQNGRFAFDDSRTGAPTTGLAVANAAMGLFSTYAEIGQRAYTPYRNLMFEFFGQDSWKATPKFRLELGVRYTIMQPYFYSLWGNIAAFDPRRYDPSKAVTQDPRTGYILSGDRYNGVTIPGTGFPDAAHGRIAIADTGEFNRLFNGGNKTWGELQKLNFQPRVGVAYLLSPKTVVRSGFGRFMAVPATSSNIPLGGNPPFQPMASIANGQADNPAGGLPSNFPFFFTTTDSVFKIPTAYSWHVTVERQVGFNTTVQLAYVGRVGLFGDRPRNINQLQPGTLQNPANAGINVNVLRPYKGFAGIIYEENAARSAYRGLQLEVNRRFRKGLSYGLAYTYSKSMDNASGKFDQVWNAYDDRNFWGPSGFDARHVAVINFIYELPFLRTGSGLTSRLLGGWQLSGVVQFLTSTPIQIGTGEDFAGIGSGGDFQPWVLNGDIKLPHGERQFSQGVGDQNFYFRTKLPDGSPIATPPKAGTFSNQTRYAAGNNPGFQNWNLALFKDFGVYEKQRLQFRAEFFNLPNHPNWGGLDTNPRSGTFGKVFSKSSERNVQLSLRYNF